MNQVFQQVNDNAKALIEYGISSQDLLRIIKADLFSMYASGKISEDDVEKLASRALALLVLTKSPN